MGPKKNPESSKGKKREKRGNRAAHEKRKKILSLSGPKSIGRKRIALTSPTEGSPQVHGRPLADKRKTSREMKSSICKRRGWFGGLPAESLPSDHRKTKAGSRREIIALSLKKRNTI